MGMEPFFRPYKDFTDVWRQVTGDGAHVECLLCHPDTRVFNGHVTHVITILVQNKCQKIVTAKCSIFLSAMAVATAGRAADAAYGQWRHSRYRPASHQVTPETVATLPRLGASLPFRR